MLVDLSKEIDAVNKGRTGYTVWDNPLFNREQLKWKFDIFIVIMGLLPESDNTPLYTVHNITMTVHDVKGSIHRWTVENINLFNLCIMNVVWKKYNYLLNKKHFKFKSCLDATWNKRES